MKPSSKDRLNSTLEQTSSQASAFDKNQPPLTTTTLISPPASSLINTLNPTVNSSPTKQAYSTLRKIKAHSKLRLTPLVIILVLVIGIALTYFVILPNQWDNSYLAKVTPAYNQQSAKMLGVYEAFALPAYTSSNTTYKSDMKNYAASAAAVSAAQASTNKLEKANVLQTAPGPLLLNTIKLTEKKYLAMKQYVNTSQTFLSNFSTLVTYLQNLEQIEKTQIPIIFTAISSFNNANNMQAVLQSSEDTSSAISALITTVQALRPPQDLQKFNNTLLADLNALNAAFDRIISGINSLSNSQILAGAQALEDAGVQMQSDSNVDWTGSLQKHSIIHQEIVSLETDNPLEINSSNPSGPSFAPKSQAASLKNAFPSQARISLSQKVLDQIK